MVSNLNVQACLNNHTSGAQWYFSTTARSPEFARDGESLEKSERENMEEVLARALGTMDLGECNDNSRICQLKQILVFQTP